MFTETDLTLENTQNLKIAPYTLSYQGLKQQFDKSELDPSKENRAFRVMDFTPTEDSYLVMQKEHFQGLKNLDEDESNENPVEWPQYFGGTLEYDVFK